MSKYGEIVALAEMFMKLGKESKDDKTKPSRTVPKKEDKKEVNLLALMEEKRREYLALKNFVEEQGKLNKPEEKKEKKEENPFNVRNVALFLIASSPITGPLYVAWFRLLMGH